MSGSANASTPGATTAPTTTTVTADSDVPPITLAERVDVRRFLGRSVRGYGATIDPFGRTFVEDPTLEWRLSNLTTDELPVLRQKLADLNTLDAAIVAASDGLDTAKAAVWTRNPLEMSERNRLYTDRRMDLAWFLGVNLGEGVRSANRVRLVV